MSPIGDQGIRGTCLAWAATAAHEKSVHEQLSVEYLHWACDPPSGGRGTIPALTSALRSKGQPSESQWAYDDLIDEKAPGYAPPSTVVGPFWRANLRRISTGPSDLASELNAGRFPVAAIRVTRAFVKAEKGVVHGSDPGTDGHAVTIVGVAELTRNLGSLSVGERLICARNSWGTSWGTGGLALISETAWHACVMLAFVLEGPVP